MSALLPSSLIPSHSEVFEFAKTYCEQASRSLEGFPGGVSVLGRELLQRALSGIGASFSVIPGQPDVLKSLESPDSNYYEPLTEDQAKIVKVLADLFGQFLSKSTQGALTASFQPESTDNHTVHCFAFENPGQLNYAGIFYTGQVPAVTAFDQDIFREELSWSTVLHELFHMFQLKHPVELPGFNDAPDFLKFLMSFRNKRFSYLLEYSFSPQTLPNFSDNASRALANWLDARNINGTMLGPDWPILDKNLLRYRLAPSAEQKLSVLNQTSHELIQLMQRSADILLANNATAVQNPALVQTPNTAVLSSAAVRNKPSFTWQPSMRQFGNGFAQGFTSTIWNAFVHARAGLSPSQTWMLQHLAGPVVMVSLEFACLSPFKNPTQVGVHIAWALGPRLLEALSFAALGRCIPGFLPELRQFHGYLGLVLIAKHLASQQLAVGLTSLAAGFVGGHLGKVLAHVTIRSCQKWPPSRFGLLFTAQQSEPESSTSNANPSPPLSGPSLWLHSLEKKAGQLDRRLAGWVKQSWGLDFMYRRFLPLNLNSSPVELPV